MTPQDLDTPQIATLATDRLAMQDTLSRYAWGYDEGDFDMVADSFTEDATTGGTVANSDASWGPTAGNREIADMLQGIRQQQTDQRRHTMHTFRFENQTDTSADLYSYVVIISTENAVTNALTAGWYHASMVKESDGQWRMADLTAQLDGPF